MRSRRSLLRLHGLPAALTLVLGTAAFDEAALARSFWYSGELAGDVSVHVEQRFDLEGMVGPFTAKAARYESFEGPVNRQRIENFRTECTPPPDRVTPESDRHGNRFEAREWRNAPSRIVCTVDFTARLVTNLEALGALTESPLDPARERSGVPYLQDARMLDQDDRDIRALARKLGQGARGQIDALVAVLRYVVDHVDYVVNPPSYSATEALEKGRGNCQNYAHLAVALLHDLGLEARVVNGLSLKHAWRVPLPDGTLTFDNAQGRHAWVEVRLADLGWVSFDPQSSHFFVSTNLIRQAVALESAEVADRFTGFGRRNRFQETIETEYANETNTLALRAAGPVPESFIVAGLVLPAVGGAEVAPAPPRPKPLLVVDPRLREQEPAVPVVTPPAVVPTPVTKVPPAPPAVAAPAPSPPRPPAPKPVEPPAPPPRSPRAPGFDQLAEIGLLDLSEQAYEYATSKEVYAQRFEIRRPLRLWEAELALQRFGGEQDGALWVELLDDVGGLPGARARFTSTRVPLSEVPLGREFAWVPFSFRAVGESAALAPGRYWLALRYTPDAIVNWHCRIGNPYLDPDDTRSRPLAGGPWSNLLHVDFNFLLTGLE